MPDMPFIADLLSVIKPSPTIAVSTKAAELKAAGRDDRWPTNLTVFADVPAARQAHHTAWIFDRLVAVAITDQPFDQRTPSFNRDWRFKRPEGVDAFAASVYAKGWCR